MRARLLLPVLAAATCLVPSALAAPPPVAARAYIVVNTDADEILAALQPDRRLAMASTTKLMTAIVTLQHAKLTDMVTVPEDAAPGGSSAGLVPGERISVRDLLRGLLVGSGNDAAVVLADHVGGSVTRFVGMMNQQAVRLGLTATHFANPHGLDAPGHYASVRDLVTLGRYARERYPFVRATVRNRSITIPGPNGVGVRRLESENDLLSIDAQADGIKTGHTDDAGYSIVAHATDPRRKMGLYLAMIGEPSAQQRAIDAKRLLDWGFRQYARPRLLTATEPVIEVPVRDRPGVRVSLVAQTPLSATLNLAQPISRVIAAPPEIVTPAKKGDAVGSVTYMAGSRVIGKRRLVLQVDVAEPGIFERIRAGLGRLL